MLDGMFEKKKKQRGSEDTESRAAKHETPSSSRDLRGDSGGEGRTGQGKQLQFLTRDLRDPV